MKKKQPSKFAKKLLQKLAEPLPEMTRPPEDEQLLFFTTGYYGKSTGRTAEEAVYSSLSASREGVIEELRAENEKLRRVLSKLSGLLFKNKCISRNDVIELANEEFQ